MRTFFTALTFIIILLAVIPAVRRSFVPTRQRSGATAPPDKS